MEEKYLERKSYSTTEGIKEDGVWKVVTTATEERRENSESEWEVTAVSVMVYDKTFETAQKLSVGFLYNRITEAMEKTGGTSLFELDLEEKEKDDKSETESN